MINGQPQVSGKKPETPGRNAAYPIAAVHQLHTLLVLRWVLIIATSYLVLFSRPLADLQPAAALFVAAYLASNVALSELLPRVWSAPALDWVLLLFDAAALCVAVELTGTQSGELFVLYFVVLFLSALSERIALVVGAAVVVTIAQLYTVSHFVDVGILLQQGYMLRVPFLFVVALFFSQLVQHARARERATEEERARVQRLQALSAISHDLKNPLGVIESLSDLLLEGSAGPLSEEQADLTRRIRASTRQAIALSANLIDAERIEAGQLPLERRPVNVARVVDDALGVARSASDLKGVALRCTVAPDLPPAFVDPVQVERVVLNLLSNAIKFTPAGGTVSVEVRRRHERLVIAVADDGPGIAAEDLPHLTERHYRGAQARGVEGSGLGLFIVGAVVRAHGGSLRISSGVGRGTTVTIGLPLGAPEPVPSGPAPAGSTPGGVLPTLGAVGAG